MKVPEKGSNRKSGLRFKSQQEVFMMSSKPFQISEKVAKKPRFDKGLFQFLFFRLSLFLSNLVDLVLSF